MKTEIKEKSKFLNKTCTSLTINTLRRFIRYFSNRNANNMKDNLCIYSKQSMQNDIAVTKVKEPVTSWVEYYSKRFDR